MLPQTWSFVSKAAFIFKTVTAVRAPIDGDLEQGVWVFLGMKLTAYGKRKKFIFIFSLFLQSMGEKSRTTNQISRS